MRSAKKITFYVPLETTSDTIQIDQVGHIVQSDGSLVSTQSLDDDCDPSTPAKEIKITITKEQVDQLFKPRLE
jgi:hypothetical protein